MLGFNSLGSCKAGAGAWSQGCVPWHCGCVLLTLSTRELLFLQVRRTPPWFMAVGFSAGHIHYTPDSQGPDFSRLLIPKVAFRHCNGRKVSLGSAAAINPELKAVGWFPSPPAVPGYEHSHSHPMCAAGDERRSSAPLLPFPWHFSCRVSSHPTCPALHSSG